MTEPTTPPAKKSSPLSIVLTSGLGFAVLGWVFQMQGRAYRTGQLDFKGLDTADFPLSVADLQWLTLIGWTEVSIRWFKNAWPAYLETLVKPGIGVFVILLVSVWIIKLFFRHRASLANRLDLRPARWWKTPSSRFTTWVWNRAKEIFGVFLAVLAAVSLAPAALWIASFFILFTVMIAILPFDSAGRLDAKQECSRGLGSLDVVHLSDAYSDIVEPRKLLCSDIQCAVISEGNVFVVPRTAVTRIDVVFSKSDDVPDGGRMRDSFCSAFAPKTAERSSDTQRSPSPTP